MAPSAVCIWLISCIGLYLIAQPPVGNAQEHERNVAPQSSADGDADNDFKLENATFFLDILLQKYGNGNTLNVEEVQHLLDVLQGANAAHGVESEHPDLEKRSVPDPSGVDVSDVISRCTNASYEAHMDPTCMAHLCLSAEDVFQIHGFGAGSEVDATQLMEMSPGIIYVAQKKDCLTPTETPAAEAHPAEVWGYSFLCVTFINLCALMGMVFMPLMRKTFYKQLLMFMVALAVGTLSGSALLFLIPGCFDMQNEENPFFEDYVWKCTTVIGGIYMFFLVERLLKNILDWRRRQNMEADDTDEVEKVPGDMYKPLEISHDESYASLKNALKSVRDNKKDKHKEDHSHLHTMPVGSVKTRSISRVDSMNMSFKTPNRLRKTSRSESIPEENSASQLVSKPSVVTLGNDNNTVVKFDLGPDDRMYDGTTDSTSSGDVSPAGQNKPRIKSVAWMVIFGDGLHNFIDGLSIGAAFSRSIMSGISVSLAVFCEELPHELGDFAILLNSGMTMRQALTYNFLSACMCYLGLTVGILLGEMASASSWIFAVAGGMFLYISLVDMLPEMNHAAEEESKVDGQVWKVFFLQNAGLLVGYGIMIVMALYSEQITLE